MPYRTMCAILPLLVVALLCLPETVFAQEQPPALIVQIRDARDHAVAHVTIRVVDAGNTTQFAVATTNQEGQAIIPALPEQHVRIQVEGQLANGTVLVMEGADAQGIAYTMTGPAQLDLRVESNGLVLPDPAMIQLDPPVAIDGASEPPSSRVIPTATSAPARNARSTAEMDGHPEPLQTEGGLWLWSGIAVLLAMALGLAIYLLRGRTI